jgi:transposase
MRLLPTPRQKKVGRKRCEKKCLVNGILQHLVNGVAWEKIAECGASPTSCWRYKRKLQRRGKFKLILKALADQKTDITEGAMDTNSTTSFRFKRMAKWDGKHKKISTKISLLSDIDGLPADVLFGSGKVHDKDFVWQHYENTKGKRKRVINFDKIYTSADLRREMRKKGTYINMQTKRGDYTRKRGPKFRFDEEKYKVRFKVERLNAWMENFRALKLRRDFLLAMFKASVYLALILILLRN